MPNINFLENQLEKKLDVSEFFGDEAYITIKKLSRTDKRAIQLMASNTSKANIQMAQDAAKLMKELNIKSYEEMTIEQKITFGSKYLDMDKEDRIESHNMVMEMEKIYIENCIDSTKHNLMDGDQLIELDISFWEKFYHATPYVLTEIKKFNAETFSLGETTESNLTIH